MKWRVCSRGPDYEVSDSGSVKRVTDRTCGKSGVVLKPWLRGGYPTVNIYGRFVGVHRLVAETYIPNPLNKAEVNHLNGDKTDPRLENLEWCSRRENAQHAHDTKLQDCRGESNGRAKFSTGQVLEIYALLANDTKRGRYARIARMFHVRESAIRRIANGTRWGHLDVRKACGVA